MGLFSRKKFGDEFDSKPLEGASAPSAQHAPESASAASQEKPMASPVQNTAPKAASARYGIEDAIRLMRRLPSSNVEIVVEVVKKTLESLSIQVPEIIVDAEKKESDIRSRIGRLQAEIQTLQGEIQRRNEEIGVLEADLAETSRVKQYLELSEKITNQEASGSGGG
jgi:predicted RNase H-like nuclease (RuvC/YqgF family)